MTLMQALSRENETQQTLAMRSRFLSRFCVYNRVSLNKSDCAMNIGHFGSFSVYSTQAHATVAGRIWFPSSCSNWNARYAGLGTPCTFTSPKLPLKELLTKAKPPSSNTSEMSQ